MTVRLWRHRHPVQFRLQVGRLHWGFVGAPRRWFGVYVGLFYFECQWYRLGQSRFRCHASWVTV